LPFGVVNGFSPHVDHPSPSTPSDVIVSTPHAAETALSPQNAPSPLSLVLKKKTAVDRAHLFCEGKHEELIRSLNTAEGK
jgi:hypothetical protein